MLKEQNLPVITCLWCDQHWGRDCQYYCTKWSQGQNFIFAYGHFAKNAVACLLHTSKLGACRNSCGSTHTLRRWRRHCHPQNRNIVVYSHSFLCVTLRLFQNCWNYLNFQLQKSPLPPLLSFYLRLTLSVTVSKSINPKGGYLFLDITRVYLRQRNGVCAQAKVRLPHRICPLPSFSALLRRLQGKKPGL